MAGPPRSAFRIPWTVRFRRHVHGELPGELELDTGARPRLRGLGLVAGTHSLFVGHRRALGPWIRGYSWANGSPVSGSSGSSERRHTHM